VKSQNTSFLFRADLGVPEYDLHIQDLGILLSTFHCSFIGSADTVNLEVVRTDAASIWATGRYGDFRALKRL
jgi:hypothetical protein